jgi:1-acyl-sn-glycerol-3-phosphate acyltransferase
MAEKFLGDIPFLGQWSSRTGQLPGLPENAARLLEDDRLLLVFPEGARGTAKLYRQRYSLVHFGSGFVRLALKTRTPVIPFAVLGAGEAFPTVANSYKLGKMLGVPYVPLVAYGLPALLPAKIEIEYAPPRHFEGTGNEDDAIVLGYVDDVKAAILSMVTAGAMRRRGETPKPSVRGAP